ncbi:PLP-dependent aminotransferase family protein [Sinanaerobacter sp. ZZT-01]|uniref:aminotransferase-like domain-containing protein n=1 Tax=Sinanaerobacter sp. ZZT-01 TaxID=3111540 RepID=UPI002D77AF1F|nr:PLP-dependent aminotransferase family protein [Sinanaerobacter sp. ZZT-01]WRR94154.1 PLP-dependent aminotransferase family protein [Sinanaerobacter sp. ZZT-01]
MKITVNHRSQTPIYRQIKNQIKEMILKEELQDGSALPSERVMARIADVHRNTIIKAYNELKADGLISASQGKGYRVTYRIMDELDLSQNETNKKEEEQKKNESILWSHLIRQPVLDLETTFDDLFSRSYDNGNISFAGGIAAPESYYGADLGLILEKLIADSKESKDDLYAYTPYQGLFELRQAISVFLQGKGINARHGEIQIVSETNQAIDYLTELFIEEGDVVITEEPISPDVFRELRLAGAKVITVPMDEEGMLTDCIEPLIVKYHPKFIYANSSYHDPTGIIMSLRRRKALLKLSYRYQVPIIEDDGASEICYQQNQTPSLKALDTCNSVIYIYSFALTFAPGIRLAFVVAPRVVIKNLSHLISLRLISFDSLSQRLLCTYMKNGMYQKNLKSICVDYRKKRDRMCECLGAAEKLGVEFKKPEGGVYIWCKLPETMNLNHLLTLAGKKGVTFIPGGVFFPYGTKGEQYIRLNYSYPGLEQIEKGMGVLLEAMEQSLEKD